MNKFTVVSTILTCIGTAGVIATAVSAAKAGPKALKVLEKAEQDKGEKLSTTEKVKAVAPVYLPTAAIGASTIACILGASILNKRQQAMLTSAYALVNNSYNRYRNKVKELYGDDGTEAIDMEIIQDVYDEQNELSVEGDEVLFFDFSTMTYFNSTMEKVITDDGLECYTITTPYLFSAFGWQ